MPYDELLMTAARIGIDEARFWRMTPIEFRRRVKAFNDLQKEHSDLEKMRQEAALRRTAWIVATIMNYAGKQLPKNKRVSVDDLLRKPDGRKDPEVMRQQLIKRHRLTERFGIN